MVAVLLARVALAGAGADEQVVEYALTVEGKAAGNRSLRIRYAPREGGERRMLVLVSDLVTPLLSATARATGASSGGTASFTSVAQIGADPSSRVQVQALDGGAEGWSVAVTDPAGPIDRRACVSQRCVSTLDLYDPVRNRALAEPGPIGLVVAETGEVLSGTVGPGVPVRMRVDGKETSATRYTLEFPPGDGAAAARARVDLGASGLLLRAELSWSGVIVTCTATSLPAPRSFGDVPVLGPPGVAEESL